MLQIKNHNIYIIDLIEKLLSPIVWFRLREFKKKKI